MQSYVHALRFCVNGTTYSVQRNNGFRAGDGAIHGPRVVRRRADLAAPKWAFKDVDSIPLGQDFRGHLNEVVGGCAAVLAIIGPRWTDARNNAGQRRLEYADDFVRIELEAALAIGASKIPARNNQNNGKTEEVLDNRLREGLYS
jgi:hypothetical protein